MADDFRELSAFTISDHGDAREQSLWQPVSAALSQYEVFWQSFIVLLTSRIDPNAPAGRPWVRLRPTIGREYEELAMYNYSVFYYAATARELIEEDRHRLAAKQHPYPEHVFFSLRSSTENENKLRKLAAKILTRLNIPFTPAAPPTRTFEAIRKYRNAFMHNPVLGRGVTHSRELLPPERRLPKSTRLVLWRDIGSIPDNEMIDGLALAERLWQDLADSLQNLWKFLADAFIQARQNPQFIADLNLAPFLPIQKPSLSLAGPVGASGTIIIARSDAP